jgi:plasmid stabilization system protein ParE
MGKEKIIVTWEEDALYAIQCTLDYIAEEAPQTAARFALELIDFGNSLNNFPGKHRLCLKPVLAKRHFRCVTFKSHTFVYRLEVNQVRIYKVFHASQHPKKLQVKKE